MSIENFFSINSFAKFFVYLRVVLFFVGNSPLPSTVPPPLDRGHKLVGFVFV